MIPTRTIDAHVAGQGVRLVADGWPPMRGRSVAQKLAFARRELDALRRAIVCEPRGHRDLTAALLTEGASSEAHAGLIAFDAYGWLPLCVTTLIGALTVAVERGLLMTGREDGRVAIETAAGVVRARLHQRGTRVERVTIACPPASVAAGGVEFRTGTRSIRADLAECGGLHAILDAEAAGVGVAGGDLHHLRALAAELTERLASAHAQPVGTVLFMGAPHGAADLRVVAVHGAARVDRSPSGLGTAAIIAVLEAMGMVPADRPVIVEGLSGEAFAAEIVRRHDRDGVLAVDVEVTGSAWVVGEHVLHVDPADPLRDGFVV